MENIRQKILLAIGIVIIAAAVIIIFFQQKAINEIRSQLAPAKQSSQPASGASQNYNRPELEKMIKIFSGEIKAISGNYLTVEAQLIDLSKPKNSDKLKSGQRIPLLGGDFGTLTKTFKVLVDEKTVLEAKKLADLKIGDMVRVASNESIYDNSEITAFSVSTVNLPQ